VGDCVVVAVAVVVTVVVAVVVGVDVGVCASAVHKLNMAKRREAATAIFPQGRFSTNASAFDWTMIPPVVPHASRR
jgi:MFS superfamily sulfate permease-like transporter